MARRELRAATGTPPARGPSAHGDDCDCVRCVGALPGNSLATKHGSWESELRLSQTDRHRELVEAIVATQPVSHPADLGVCERLALVYIRIERSAAAIETAESVNPDKPLASYSDRAQFMETLRRDHARWLRLAGEIEASLGRTPASRAKLQLHLSSAARQWTVADLHAQAEVEEIEGEAVEEAES